MPRQLLPKIGGEVLPPIGEEVRPSPTPTREKGLATIGEQLEAKRNPIVDVGIGAAKGVGNTLFGMGKMVRDYTPVGRISDWIETSPMLPGTPRTTPGAFDQRPPEITPTNTAQRIGFTGEQVGEFMLPIAALNGGRVMQAARAGAQTMMQSGSPVEAGVSAGLSAVLPGASAAKNASGFLRDSAEKTMAQALGATKEKFKEKAAELAPEMLNRGIKGTRKAMLNEATAATKAVGQQLDAAYSAAAQAGDTVAGNLISGHLQLASDALKVKNAAGKLITIPGTERVVDRLAKLDAFVKTLGPDIPVDRAAKVKRTFDKIVDKAGLFGAKATASATDNADAWAIREASGAFRDLLNRNATIADLNAEFAFQKGLKDVLKATVKRTQSQRSGLTDAVRSAAGATMGAAVGGPVGAAAGAVGMEAVSRAWNSPIFKTAVAGPFKNLMADALASGNTGQILSAVKKITTSLPAQMRTAQ